jgi:EAL domain-containing protein (putative c-di-GMP-specific phosphodiesterase class I)
MDVAYVARFEDGRQMIRAATGDAASFDLHVGSGPPLQETYCARMVRGQIPSVIPDTAAVPEVAALPITARSGIGAYIGVPLHLPNGEVYGTFCCLNHQPALGLDERDVAFLALLSDLLAEDIVEETRLRGQRRRIRDLLDTGGLAIAAQPVVDLGDARCHSMEALARFPTLGPPDLAFAMADEVGLRVDLEVLCIREAVGLLAHIHPTQSLAINMSPDVALQVLDELAGTVPLDRLIVEITEHAEVGTYDTLRSALVPLRRRGLRLAVDDAGAGFASLRHVVELRPDIIKVDRALVAGIDADPSRRSAVTTFVLLALDLGATVVAEGVETEAELLALMSLGVDAAQGFLLARPSSDVLDLERWGRPGGVLTSRRLRRLWARSGNGPPSVTAAS